MKQLLGKKPKREDPRTFKLARYLTHLPPAPATVDWTRAVSKWGMLDNDNIGDCVPAGMMHMVMLWAANAGKPIPQPTDAEAIANYEVIGGYNPSDPSTDQGCDMLTALQIWRSKGILVGGQTHRIAAFAEVNLKNPAEVKAALYLFGGLFTGWALPASAQGENTWFVPVGGPYGDTGAPGSWGGHCAPLAAEDGSGEFRAITWGSLTPATHNFVADYSEEAYAVISPEWIEQNGKAPSGFNLAALEKDLAAL
jgi:hypothetical protein